MASLDENLQRPLGQPHFDDKIGPAMSNSKMRISTNQPGKLSRDELRKRRQMARRRPVPAPVTAELDCTTPDGGGGGQTGQDMMEVKRK